ncbi:MAG: glycosyltransferase family 4 protein, partial [Nanoarchaeota archaeon]
FAGSIPNTDLPSFYKAADVFVLPSIIDSKGDTEGLGVVLLEAIAAGTPVVASNVGGIPDVITSNKTGLLVGQKNPAALSKAIVSLLKNSWLRKRFGTAAKIRVEKNFSWEKIAAEFAKVYDSIISRI